MKAIVLNGVGGVEHLQMADVARPTPGDNEVLIQTKAISINPVDDFIRQNETFLQYVVQPRAGEYPIILGWDISGVVVDTGGSVTSLKKGDEIFGLVKFPGHGKAYAEFVTAPEDQLALKPANISHAEAAAATLAALTAWQSLVKYGKIKKGDKVLIHAAAGGVGHYAVQLAKHFGAFVIGTSSPVNREFLFQLGIDQHIDYTSQRFEDIVKDADLVLDPIGEPGHLDRSLNALRSGGSLISLLTTFDDPALLKKIADKNVFAHRLSVASNGEEMQAIAELLKNGSLHSHVSEVFPFDQMRQAHTSVASGKTRGKIVVTL